MKRKWIVWILIVSLVSGVAGSTVFAKKAHAEPETPVGEQVATDLIAAGVSLTAAMSGNVPLALLAGFLTKYISTYGVKGIRAMTDFFKGYTPQDLGQINLYYVYLLNAKRNLYQTLITIRKAVKADDSLSLVSLEIEALEKSLTEQCKADQGCAATGMDPNLVNTMFVDIVLDAKQSIEVSKYLSAAEIKNTYQYLILLYLDVIIVEQKLLEAQYNVLATRSVDTLKLLRKNPYLSPEEKEYQAQSVLNLGLRYLKLAETRRVLVAKAIASPLAQIQSENQELRDDILEYRRRAKKKGAAQ